MSRYRFYDEPVVRPPVFVVPAGAVEPRTSGWTVRRRGDTEGSVKHTYRCPVHGLVDAYVSRADVPDEVACPAMDPVDSIDLGGEIECSSRAHWAGSLCGIGFAAGEVTG